MHDWLTAAYCNPPVEVESSIFGYPRRRNSPGRIPLVAPTPKLTVVFPGIPIVVPVKAATPGNPAVRLARNIVNPASQGVNLASQGMKLAHIDRVGRSNPWRHVGYASLRPGLPTETVLGSSA